MSSPQIICCLFVSSLSLYLPSEFSYCLSRRKLSLFILGLISGLLDTAVASVDRTLVWPQPLRRIYSRSAIVKYLLAKYLVCRAHTPTQPRYNLFFISLTRNNPTKQRHLVSSKTLTQTHSQHPSPTNCIFILYSQYDTANIHQYKISDRIMLCTFF